MTQNKNQKAVNKALIAGVIIGLVGGISLSLSIAVGAFAAVINFGLFETLLEETASSVYDGFVTPEQFQEGYDDGYEDGIGDYSEFGDLYHEYEDRDMAETYHDGYVAGFFDGCDDGDWNCDEWLEAMDEGWTGMPMNDVLHRLTPQSDASIVLAQVISPVYASSADIYEARNEAVVAIYDEFYGFVGSGVILNEDGLIVSNHHVLDMLEAPSVQDVNGQEYEIAGIYKVDETHDLVLFWIEAEEATPFIPIADPDSVRVGEDVVVIGNPEGYINTISTGELSGKRVEDGQELLQTTAPITYGSSGGALLNQNGELIGIVNSGYDYGNLNFAIPTDDIIDLIED